MGRQKKKVAATKAAKPTVLKLHDPTDATTLRDGVKQVLEALGVDPSTVGAMGGPFNNDGTYRPLARGACLGARLTLWQQDPVPIGHPPRRSADETRLEIVISGGDARTVLLDVRGENQDQKKAVLAAIADGDNAVAAPEAEAVPEPSPDLPASDIVAVLAPMPEGDEDAEG